MSELEKAKKRLVRRKRSIRLKVVGTSECPRLTVKKSLRYISAQIIDDASGLTLVSASTMENEHKKEGKNIKAAEMVGRLLGERAKGKNISRVVFDRNGYPYHGKVKALADAARTAGLQF